VHLTDLVRKTGVKEHALGRRGFTRVNVRTDTDVAIATDRSLASHLNILVKEKWTRNG
jgi:hypothetical protein